MGALERTSEKIRSVHGEFTQAVTVHSYEYDETAGSNEYADGDWTEETRTVQASVREATAPRFDTDEAGPDTIVSRYIFVNPEDLSMEELVTNEGDNTRPTEFTDEDGRTYRAVDYKNEVSLLRIECREVN